MDDPVTRVARPAPSWGERPDPVIRFVACLDVLGLRAALTGRGEASLADDYARALNAAWAEQRATSQTTVLLVPAWAVEDEGRPGSADAFAEPHVLSRSSLYKHIEHVVAFSDSLFVFSRDDSSESLEEVSDFSNAVFRYFLKHALPMRGAIARGSCIVWPKANIYVGQAIVAAYELEERLKVLGVVLHENIDRVLLETRRRSTCAVPVKGTPESLDLSVAQTPALEARRVKVDDWERRLSELRAAAGDSRDKYDRSTAILRAMLT